MENVGSFGDDQVLYGNFFYFIIYQVLEREPRNKQEQS